MLVLLLNAVVCCILLTFSSGCSLCLWAGVIALGIMTLQSFRFYRQSRTDDLTGLNNLRRLEDMTRSYRRHRRIGVWYFDLDHLKLVNDTEGHTAGDRLLKAFAATLSAASHRGAMAYRVGGDEFLLIVPNPDGSIPPLPEHSALPATWGFAEGDGRKLRELIVQAEQEMYRRRSAKEE